jgi:hypothetical protein
MGWFSRFFKKEKQEIVTNGVILPGNKVLLKLFEVWPKFNPGRLYLADRTYVMPSKKEVEKLLFDSRIDEYVHTAHSSSPKSGILDCDDFTLLLHAYVVRKRYEDFKAKKLPKDQQYPLAFGEIWYNDPNIGLHSINICFSRDKGILLIEPQSDEIWKAALAQKGKDVRLIIM